MQRRHQRPAPEERHRERRRVEERRPEPPEHRSQRRLLERGEEARPAPVHGERGRERTELRAGPPGGPEALEREVGRERGKHPGQLQRVPGDAVQPAGHHPEIDDARHPGGHTGASMLHRSGSNAPAMRVALVHDWLTGRRGGELVLAQLVRALPRLGDLHPPPRAGERGSGRGVAAHPHLAAAAGARASPTATGTLLPADARARSASSTSAGSTWSSPPATAWPRASGCRRASRHLAYVHSPMRYMWDQFDDYFGPGRAGLPVRLAACGEPAGAPGLGPADRGRPRPLVANSQHMARRIARFWGREADVIHPPVDLDRFARPAARRRAGRLLPLARGARPLQAGGPGGGGLPRERGSALWIAGDGQDARLLREGLPPNVRWLGKVPDAEVPGLYRGARALVFPGEEDFGIAPLEALASGRPVIALGARRRAGDPHPGDRPVLRRARRRSALVEALGRFEAFERGFDPAGPGRARRCSPRSASASQSARRWRRMTRRPPDLRDRLPW